MKNRLILITLLVILSFTGTGCIDLEPNHEEDVQEVVLDFMEHVNEGDFDDAFQLAGGRGFSPEATIGTTRLLAPASIEVEMRNNGFVRNSIDNVEITEIEVQETIAVVSTNCTILQFNAAGRLSGEVEKELFFKLQRSGTGWIINRISFDGPMMITQEEIDSVVIEQTPVDSLIDNAVPLFGLSVALLLLGLYVNSKEKKNNSKKASFDTRNAKPIQKGMVKRFIRIIPSKENEVNKKAYIDFWVKNFSKQPYNNFQIAVKYSPTISIKDPILDFGTIKPGETVTRTLTVIPLNKGWNSIEEIRVLFEYSNNKYLSVIDDPINIGAK